MLRFIIYLFPAMVDMLVGTFFFVSTVRMAESGASALAVTGLLTVWGVFYMVCCFLVGRKVTANNCVPMMIGSAAVIALCSATFLVFPALGVLYVIMAAFGIAVAFFFPPFQVFMKAFESGGARGLMWTTALYTVSWSLGLAAGPFISGYLWSAAGWRSVCVLDILLAVAVGFGTFLVNRARGRARVGDDAVPVTVGAGEYDGKPDMIRVAWLAGGIFLLVLSGMRGVFPSTAVHYQIAKTHQGNVLALVCFSQAVVAFLLRNSRQWVYRPLPIVLFGLVGVAGFVLFGTARNWAAFYLAAVCVGVCAGSIYLYMVFHALVHPNRAGRYAGTNESIVGLSGITGPLAAGLMSDRVSVTAPYCWGAALFAIMVALQAAMHGTIGKKEVMHDG